MELDRDIKATIAIELARDCALLQEKNQMFVSLNNQSNSQEAYRYSQEMLYIARKIVFSCKMLNGHTPEY